MLVQPAIWAKSPPGDYNEREGQDRSVSCVCRSIAQGCSEYNITVLIDQKDSVRALRAVHGRFYLATLPLGVGLVGPGLIGGTFLDQIHQQMTVRASPHSNTNWCNC